MRAKVLNYCKEKPKGSANASSYIAQLDMNAAAERAGLKWRMSFLSLSDHDDARIEQHLTPIGIVRRSRSLPDSDATDHADDFNDFLSSRSGASGSAEKKGIGATTATPAVHVDDKITEEKLSPSTLGEGLSPADNALLGFEEALPRAKRKDETGPHSPLIKLTPFSEEQRRAMVSETDDVAAADTAAASQREATGDKVLDAVAGVPEETATVRAIAGIDEAAEAPKRRKSTPSLGFVIPKSAQTRKRSLANALDDAEQMRRRSRLRHQESIDRVARYLGTPTSESAEDEGASVDYPLPLDESRLRDVDDDDDWPRTVPAMRFDEDESEGEAAAAAITEARDLLVPERQEEVAAKKRSSLRRRREDPAESVVKDQQDQAAALPETTKKTVRICSVEEEIRIESFDSVDTDELIPFTELQEVQLVTAKILTAEELADSMTRRGEGILTSPMRDDEAATLISRLATDTRLQLPSPSLKTSASENALTAGRGDVDKISERNIKPEILMDLSRVDSGGGYAMDASATAAERAMTFDDEMMLGMPRVNKRKLSRVSSDSACRAPDVVKFHLGGGDLSCLSDDELSSRHSQVDLVRYGLQDEVVPVVTPPKSAIVVWEADKSERVADVQVETETQDARKWRSFEDVPSAELGDRLRRTSSDGSAYVAAREGRSQQRHHRPPPRTRHALVPEGEPHLRSQPADVSPQQQRLVDGRYPAGLICREHSLRYQRQTLESPASLEDLLGTDASSQAAVEELEAETLDYSSAQSLLSVSCKSYGSPKREVQTQTQGEHKSTQYEVEDLVSLVEDVYDKRSDSRERLELLLEARFGSPRREVEVQTEQESKGVQCVSEELDAAADELGPYLRRQPSFGSPRREAQVQTGQDTKCTQCNFEEFSESTEGLARVQWKEPLSSDQAPPERRPAECSASSVESSSTGSSSSPHQIRPPPTQEQQQQRLPLIVLIKGGATYDMTVTHRDKDGNVVWAKHWGPERLVEIYREAQTSLGLSIVGGKVDLQDSSSSSKSQNVSGIFIKNVLPNSPAGRAGGLQTGDRIIEVDGVDLRTSTHERAVKAIQAAGNPVRLLVQSLVHLSPDNEGPDGAAGHRAGARRQSTRNRMGDGGSPRSRSPEVIQEGRPDLKRQGTTDGAGPSGRRSSMKKSMRKKAPSPPGGALPGVSEEREDKPKAAAAAPPKPPAEKNKYSSGESSEEEEDTREMEGNVYTKSGVEISRKSAGNVKRTKEEIAADPEEEDEYGYTTSKVKKKYHHLKKPVFFITLERSRKGLGISLAGHKDRNKMAVFICGLNPNGMASKSGLFQVGDELLEVNGAVFQGRCHLNASAMIKGMGAKTYKMVTVRAPSGIENCAVKQVIHFPSALAGEDFSQFKGVREVPIKKGTYGLGIMIIEGKHAEVGQGIFVSDVQEGGAAEQAGLNVGDMILSVNADSVMGATYDEATGLLKAAEGMVTLTVCNPNQKKVAEDLERMAKGEPEPAKDLPKEPEKPKEPEAPADPKECKIKINKDTNIEFPKDKDKPIGFVVVGGNDTPLNAVFILDVFPDGAAGKDGRLQPGDRIVEINKESFKAVDSEKAYQTVLRITQGPILMTIHRAENAFDEIEVELTKKAGKGSGLILMGYKSGKGAYVSEVVAGGSAAESGKIVKGDRVVAVGGQDLREAPVEDIALHVKVSNPVQLKLARYKTK